MWMRGLLRFESRAILRPQIGTRKEVLFQICPSARKRAIAGDLGWPKRNEGAAGSQSAAQDPRSVPGSLSLPSYRSWKIEYPAVPHGIEYFLGGRRGRRQCVAWGTDL